MDEPISADNPGMTTADNPTGPADVTTGTGATNGQGPGAPPADDIFKGVDPSRLPPEAKAAYDSMLKDYRDKTARISETTKSEVAKAVEAYKQKAESYDQFTGQEEFVKMWNDFASKAGQSTGEPGDPITKLQEQFQQMQNKIAETELIQVTDSFADAVNEKGEKMHPDFDKLNSMTLGKTQKGQEVTLLRAFTELSPGKNHNEKLANGYKAAKAFHDQIFEEGKKAGLSRTQSKILNGSNPPSNLSGDFSTTEKRPKSAHEAYALAKKGIVVSR